MKRKQSLTNNFFFVGKYIFQAKPKKEANLGKKKIFFFLTFKS